MGTPELNLVGVFQQGPWRTDAAILAEINTRRDNWFPGTKELTQFARSGGSRGIVVREVADINAVFCAILRFKPRRVNIFTHGLALRGSVVKGDVIYSSASGTDLGDPQDIEDAKIADFACSGKPKTVADVRDALPKNAEMIIYGCDSGADLKSLRRIAGLLGIPVRGFSKDVRYHPVPGTRRGVQIIQSWKYSTGSSPQVSDYHNLAPDVSASPSISWQRREITLPSNNGQ